MSVGGAILGIAAASLAISHAIRRQSTVVVTKSGEETEALNMIDNSVSVLHGAINANSSIKMAGGGIFFALLIGAAVWWVNKKNSRNHQAQLREIRRFDNAGGEGDLEEARDQGGRSPSRGYSHGGQEEDRETPPPSCYGHLQQYGTTVASHGQVRAKEAAQAGARVENRMEVLPNEGGAALPSLNGREEHGTAPRVMKDTSDEWGGHRNLVKQVMASVRKDTRSKSDVRNRRDGLFQHLYSNVIGNFHGGIGSHKNAVKSADSTEGRHCMSRRCSWVVQWTEGAHIGWMLTYGSPEPVFTDCDGDWDSKLSWSYNWIWGTWGPESEARRSADEVALIMVLIMAVLVVGATALTVRKIWIHWREERAARIMAERRRAHEEQAQEQREQVEMETPEERWRSTYNPILLCQLSLLKSIRDSRREAESGESDPATGSETPPPAYEDLEPLVCEHSSYNGSPCLPCMNEWEQTPA